MSAVTRPFLRLGASVAALPKRLIAFGLLTAFWSSLGQTFFIALSNADFRAAYGLSNAELAAIYSGATLTSAGCMLLLGRLIDRVDLRLFTALSVLVLAAGTVLVTLPVHVAMLGVGLLCLRLGGQGLLSHAAAVSAARSAGHTRGKASGLALLGHAAGEAVLPLLWVAAAGLVAWETAWRGGAVALVALYLPLAVLVLPRTARHAETAGEDGTGATPQRQVPLFSHPRFAPLLLCAITPGAMVTAAVFHLQALGAAMPDGSPQPAVALPALAAGAVIGGVGGGALVDRFGGPRILALGLVPLALGCLLWAPPPLFVLLAAGLFGMGMSAGAINAAAAPAWVELFGLGSVGRARAVQAFVMVAGTAVGPVVYGLGLDAGVGRAIILGLSALLVAGATVVGLTLGRAEKAPRPAVGR